MFAFLIKTTKAYFYCYSGLPTRTWAGIFLCFFESFFIAIYYFLPIYFTQSLNLTILDSGFIVACFGLGTIFGGYAGGRFSDKYQPQQVCMISLLLQSLVFLLCVFAYSRAQLSVILFFMGFFSYTFLTANYLLILSECSTEENKLKAINITNVMANLSLAFSACLMAFLNSNYFRGFFLISSFILAILGFLSLSIKSSGLEVSEESDDKQQIGAPTRFMILARKKILSLVFVCTFLMGFIIFQTSTTYSMYIHDSFPELGMQALSILLGLNCIMVVFLQTPIGNYITDFNKLKLMGWSAFLIGMGMVTLTFYPNFAFAMLACIVYTSGEMIFSSISQLLCYEIGENKGKIMGAYRSVYASTRVIAPSIGGIIFYYFGGRILWWFCGGLGMICLILCHYNGRLTQ